MKFDMTDNEVRADVVICVTLLIAGTALMSYNSLSNAPAPPVTVPVKAPVAHRAAKAGPAPIAKTPAKYVGQYNGSFHVGSSPISGRNGKAELKINAKGGAIGFAWLPPNELHLLLGKVDGSGTVEVSCNSVGSGSSTGAPQGQFKKRFNHDGLWKPYQCEFNGQATATGKSASLKIEGLDNVGNHEVINLTRSRR